MIRHIVGIVCVRQTSKRSAQKPRVQWTSVGSTGVRLAAAASRGAKAVKKLEIRNPNLEANQKFKVRISAAISFRILNFGFVSDFDIRISDLFRDAFDSDGNVRPAGEFDFAVVSIAIKIVSLLLHGE